MSGELALMVRTRAELCRVLLEDEALLPVRPLLRIVAEYAVDCEVSVWFSGVSRPNRVHVRHGGFVFGYEHGIYRYDRTGQLEQLVGGHRPNAICIDPYHPNRLFLATVFAVRCLEYNILTLVRQLPDFSGYGLLMTRDCKRLVYGTLHGLRSFPIRNEYETPFTLSNGHSCNSMSWSRATAPPQSVIYVTAPAGSRNNITRVDINTCRATNVQQNVRFPACGIDCAPSGHLLVSTGRSQSADPSEIWSIHPSTGECKELHTETTQGASMVYLDSITIVDNEFALAISDWDAECVKRLPLPDHLFTPHFSDD